MTEKLDHRNLLKELDYSVLQQCMHCGMCLPTCPTYEETKLERHSPRGRISLMRAIADDELEVTKEFGDEMYYCLGCLACVSACPAGVDYASLFETSRAEIERQGVMENSKRNFIRTAVLRVLFTRPRLLRLFGRLIWFWQASGLRELARRVGGMRFLPKSLQRLEPQSPTILRRFSHQLIRPVEKPLVIKRRVALLTGCVQDLAFADINRATVDVLLANHCEVVTPKVQPCCGSLHAHNGDLQTARILARRQLDLMDPDDFDAIISNAGGCGSHLKNYHHLLKDDPKYAERAARWDRKLKDIHEYLVEIEFRIPRANKNICTVTYHESCHLCHGQKVSSQPREILRSIPGVELRECAESQWCCGSAGIYSITQPETASRLQKRKIENLLATKTDVVVTANPGCHLQIVNGLRDCELPSVMKVKHPIVLLAEAYQSEPN